MTTLNERVHGYTLSARLEGPASGPVLVLVHGMMEGGAIWEPMMERLARHYRCVLLDLPWNGTQDALWGCRASPVQWLRRAVQTFDLRPEGWLAHSFGASALLALLADRGAVPGAGAPAVLVSPFYKAAQEDVTWQLFHQYVNEFQDFVELSIRARSRRLLSPALLRRMAETARDSFGCYVWTEFWRLFSAMPRLPIARVRQPVLVLAGAEDPCARLPDIRALAGALADAGLEVLADASHFLLDTHRSTTEALIREFMLTNCPVVPTRPQPSGKRPAATYLQACP